MRWLVTGATGFIGTTLVERLLARNDEVRALVRDPGRAGALAAMGARLVRGDVSEPDSLADAVPDVDVVVHLAGLVKALTREQLFAVNAEGTRSLARAAAVCLARAVPSSRSHRTAPTLSARAAIAARCSR